MCRLIETIKLTPEGIHNLPLHNERCNRARRALFGVRKDIDLGEVIPLPRAPHSAPLMKCRIVYREKVEEVRLEPYRLPVIRSLKLVWNDDIDYAMKYEDRRIFDALLALRGYCDEVLIVRRGRLTDTSFSNIVLYDGERYVTPREPLLAGVKRQSLLNAGRVLPRDLAVKDLNRFTRLYCVNCMIDLENEVSVPIEAIVRE
ncbi:MAG TPA: hypothetical protein ENN69_02030 [Spirochaetia bacterium]|nr:hypothetical protein [Spirochaetia bacterium]